MRFTLRDLLWFTAVVASMLGMWLQAARLTDSNKRLNAVPRHSEALCRELGQAEQNEPTYVERLAEAYVVSTPRPIVMWR